MCSPLYAHDCRAGALTSTRRVQDVSSWVGVERTRQHVPSKTRSIAPDAKGGQWAFQQSCVSFLNINDLLGHCSIAMGVTGPGRRCTGREGRKMAITGKKEFLYLFNFPVQAGSFLLLPYHLLVICIISEDFQDIDELLEEWELRGHRSSSSFHSRIGGHIAR